MTRILRKQILPGNIEVQLIQGDITQVEVDAIVNPANSQLMHGGGLAGILARKAGPALQKESAAWVREHGPVSHQEPAYTCAGELPFKAIIHAVGPVWGSGNEADKLRAAVMGSLQRAEQLQYSSIALPAISTGIFGYPLLEAADIILNTLGDASRSGLEQLKKILVVLYDDRAASAFTRVWDGIYQ